MRQIALLFFLTLLWACKKENKEPACRFSGIIYVGSTTKLPVTYPGGDRLNQQLNCPLSETRLFKYTFTSNGLIESMSNQVGSSTGAIWGYEYECL